MLVLAVPLFGFLFAADPLPPQNLQVEVVDSSGVPVSTALVYVPKERTHHPVNTVTGIWRADSLYLPDGEGIEIKRDDVFEVDVLAPGYWPVSAKLTALGPQKVHRIALERIPAEPEARFDHLPDDLARLGDLNEPAPHLALTYASHIAEHGPAYFDDSMRWSGRALDDARTLEGPALVEHLLAAHQVRTRAALDAWEAAEKERVDKGSDPAWERAQRARHRTEVAARDWLEAARFTGRSAPMAVALCQSAADQPERCLD